MSWFDRRSQPEGSASRAAPSFTPRAQQALALARSEADRLHHNFVGTEHLLLGLIKAGPCVAASVLQKLRVDLEAVQTQVEELVGVGSQNEQSGKIPYTPRVKHVLALAAKEAKSLHHTYVGTEAMLLGLIREGDGVAGRVLKNMKVGLEQVRQSVIEELNLSDLAARPDAAHVSASTPPPESIDLSKRYDLYCVEAGAEVIYRNALIKRIQTIRTPQDDIQLNFLEVEQPDGQTIFLSVHIVTKLGFPRQQTSG